MKRSTEQDNSNIATATKKPKLSAQQIAEKKRLLADKLASLKQKGILANDNVPEQQDAHKPAPFSLNSVPIHPSLLALSSSSTATATDVKFIPRNFSTTLANIKQQQQLQLAQQQLSGPATPVQKQITETQALKELRKDPHFDRTLHSHAVVAPLSRAFRPLKFTAPGKYIEEANIKRAQLQELHAQELRSTLTFKESDAVTISIKESIVPDIEWWDAMYIKTSTYPDTLTGETIDYESITGLVHHPVPITLTKKAPPPQKVILTQKETKKLRRLNRLEAQKERRDKIRMGLEKEEVAKLKMSNFMKVVGEDAVLGPTQIEAKVRKQVADRLVKGVMHDNEKKLTKEERKEKERLKKIEDMSDGVHVCLFKIKDLSNPQNKFKVSMNAKQYGLTGFCITYTHMNLVCVQGGPKALNQYKKLMLRRIDWSGKKRLGEDDDDEHHKAELKSSEWCTVCWDGLIEKRTFKFFIDKTFSTEAECRAFLKEKGVESYWDTAKSYIYAV